MAKRAVTKIELRTVLPGGVAWSREATSWAEAEAAYRSLPAGVDVDVLVLWGDLGVSVTAHNPWKVPMRLDTDVGYLLDVRAVTGDALAARVLAECELPGWEVHCAVLKRHFPESYARVGCGL